MAKQTFTTGQVLTADQMTSLQQTAMLGGSATAKTTSYVLVAADAGTTVAMSAAGATTITVNTGLFSAGDTVFIQNRGAGACTVTAGTATVATAGSLILPQNDAGILYFTATGAATFYDFIQTGAASPLTTKGDLYTYSTSDARLAVGTNTYVLTADSAEATGLKWAAAAGGGANWTLVNSGGTNLTGAQTITISGISGADKIMVVINNGSSVSTGSGIGIRLNTDTAANYFIAGSQYAFNTTYSSGDFAGTSGFDDRVYLGFTATNNAAYSIAGYALFSGCNSSGVKVFNSTGGAGGGNGQQSASLGGWYNSSSVITSVSAYSGTGNFDAGKIYVYISA